MSVLITFHKKFAIPIPSYFVAKDKRGTAPAAYKTDAIETFIMPPARMKYSATASTAAVIVTNPDAMYIAFMALCVSPAFFSSDYESIKKNASSGYRTQYLLFTR